MVAVRDMLEAERADDYVVATGKSHSVLEFANLAFKTAGLNASDYIQVDPKFFRPNEVQDLRGDASKIYSKLGWRPQTTFENLVEEMVTSDINELEK
jgi:GDPmannose 4,6-dehydratase